jgi:hypothetical protein
MAPAPDRPAGRGAANPRAAGPVGIGRGADPGRGTDEPEQGPPAQAPEPRVERIERGHSVYDAFELVKDVIRYTSCYRDDMYTSGVYADCDRLHELASNGLTERTHGQGTVQGHQQPLAASGDGRLFGVRFHAEASLEAKEITRAPRTKSCALVYQLSQSNADSKTSRSVLRPESCDGSKTIKASRTRPSPGAWIGSTAGRCTHYVKFYEITMRSPRMR